MTTIWPASTYPVALDNFTTALIDNVDEVIANHPNSLADAIMNVQSKLGIDNGLIADTGGLKFEGTGYAAPPFAPPVPSLWMDTSSGALVGYVPTYTDQLGMSYDLRTGGFIGTGYLHPVPVSVGDLVYVSAVNTVAVADAVVGNPAQGMVINVVGLLCDVAYGNEITNAAWAAVPLIAGTRYYLDTAGGFATTSPVAWTIQQEIGFARDANTLVFTPTIATT